MKYLIVFIILFSSVINAFCGAQAETSRDQTMDMINEGTFVAQSYLDAESFIDEYRFDYEPDEKKSMSIYLDIDKPFVFFLGDYVTIQVSIVTNYEEYYTYQPFAYVLCIDDPNLLEDKTNFDSILTAISHLLKIKTGKGVHQ